MQSKGETDDPRERGMVRIAKQYRPLPFDANANTAAVTVSRSNKVRKKNIGALVTLVHSALDTLSRIVNNPTQSVPVMHFRALS